MIKIRSVVNITRRDFPVLCYDKSHTVCMSFWILKMLFALKMYVTNNLYKGSAFTCFICDKMSKKHFFLNMVVNVLFDSAHNSKENGQKSIFKNKKMRKGSAIFCTQFSTAQH